MAFIKNKEPAAEPFKRAVSATMRAMSREKELEVIYGNDAPGMSGDRARLPNPSKDLPIEDVRLVRGLADSLALRKRYHDDGMHARYAPEGGDAKAVFDAIEQARVEAIGAGRMKGVAENLFNRLDMHCKESGFERIYDKADAPIAEVLGLLAREKLANIPVPESARNMVDLWRAEIEAKSGDDFAEMMDALSSQKEFANAARKLLKDLDLIDDAEGEFSDEDENGDGEEGEQEPDAERTPTLRKVQGKTARIPKQVKARIWMPPAQVMKRVVTVDPYIRKISETRLKRKPTKPIPPNLMK